MMAGSTSGQEVDNSVQSDQDRAAIRMWTSRIRSAKKRFEKDFKRMRDNMDFAAGYQWTGQPQMADNRYVSNLVLKLVSQKVATLYAKNPTAVAKRRPRMDFQIWDGKTESLVMSIMQSQQIQASGGMLPMELRALHDDYLAGKYKQQLTDRVCQTMEILYKYFTDVQRPNFKEQFKQMVRRTITCCVGYVRPIFCREDYAYGQPSTVEVKSEVADRMGRIKSILQRVQDEGLDERSETFATLRSLVMSVGASASAQDSTALPERLEFDFAPATSVIVDERCRSLKGFVAARWVAQEYILPVDEVNAIFGTDIKTGTGEGLATEFSLHGDGTSSVSENRPPGQIQMDNDPLTKSLVACYEVFDKNTKTKFYIVDGYDKYVAAPELLTPNVSGFWHHGALVFNDCEVIPGIKATIYPPSDVQCALSAQKEWNRTREALREHRNANAPTYVVRKGMLTDDDKQRLREAQPQQIIELEGVPPDQPIENFIIAMAKAPITPELYDTEPMEKDIMLATGAQQANLGPAEANVTATVGTIAEQSRLNVSASNIDDLDELLTWLAQVSGEMLLQEISPEIAKYVAGPGAVWPGQPQSREEFLNEVLLEIEASSSGRPNKAINVQNAVQLVPLLLQAGANPIAVVEYVAKTLDEQIDISQFYPLQGPMMAGPGGEPGQPGQDQQQATQNPQNMPANRPKGMLGNENDGSSSPPAGAERAQLAQPAA